MGTPEAIEVSGGVPTVEVVETFEFVAQRFTDRLVGLSDDEYFWEPVEGCWSVRADADGTWVLDGAHDGAPDATAAAPPVTTIAWRLTHLGCHALGGFGAWLRDGDPPYEGDPEVPSSAAAALDALERNWARFHQGMVQATEQRWLEPIGPQFGPHGEASTGALVLHVLDEYVHHAAEVSLLRDLYGARPLLGARTST